MVTNSSNSKFSGYKGPPLFTRPKDPDRPKKTMAEMIAMPVTARGSSIANDWVAKERGLRAPSFAKGGRVKKTGIIKVHKGEYILPKSVMPTKKQRTKVGKKHRK